MSEQNKTAVPVQAQLSDIKKALNALLSRVENLGASITGETDSADSTKSKTPVEILPAVATAAPASQMPQTSQTLPAAPELTLEPELLPHSQVSTGLCWKDREFSHPERTVRVATSR